MRPWTKPRRSAAAYGGVGPRLGHEGESLLRVSATEPDVKRNALHGYGMPTTSSILAKELRWVFEWVGERNTKINQ